MRATAALRRWIRKNRRRLLPFPFRLIYTPTFLPLSESLIVREWKIACVEQPQWMKLRRAKMQITTMISLFNVSKSFRRLFSFFGGRNENWWWSSGRKHRPAEIIVAKSSWRKIEWNYPRDGAGRRRRGAVACMWQRRRRKWDPCQDKEQIKMVFFMPENKNDFSLPFPLFFIRRIGRERGKKVHAHTHTPR